MSRFTKLILVAFGAIAGLAFLAWVAFSIVSRQHDSESRDLISGELLNLVVPPGCSENSREYQAGGADHQSSWHLLYACNTTAWPVYKAITGSLKSKDYVQSQVLQTPGSDVPSYFVYHNDGF